MNSPSFLILSGVQGDTRRYRTHHLAEQLRLAGLDVRLSHITAPDALGLAEKADCIIVHRLVWDRVTRLLFACAEKQRALVLLDIDDLVFDPEVFDHIDSPDFADARRARLYRENMRRSREVLDHCAGVLASTEFLAERARACGKPAWVHRNAFSLEMLALSTAARQAARSESDFIIGYASGTRTHDRDFALAAPAIRGFLRRHADARLWLAGHLDPGAGWDELEGRIQRQAFRPWRLLPALLAGFTVNLAPLRSDNPFGQSKSEIKFMEAGLVGVPTIASPTEAFLHAIRDQHTGLIAHSQADWEEALETLFAAPGQRRALAEAAYRDILARYAPWVRAAEALRTLDQAAEELTGRAFGIRSAQIPPLSSPEAARALWLPAKLEKHPTLFERGLHTLRSRGISTLGDEIWIYFRRLLAPIFPYK